MVQSRDRALTGRGGAAGRAALYAASPSFLLVMVTPHSDSHHVATIFDLRARGSRRSIMHLKCHRATSEHQWVWSMHTNMCTRACLAHTAKLVCGICANKCAHSRVAGKARRQILTRPAVPPHTYTPHTCSHVRKHMHTHARLQVCARKTCYATKTKSMACTSDGGTYQIVEFIKACTHTRTPARPSARTHARSGGGLRGRSWHGPRAELSDGSSC